MKDMAANNALSEQACAPYREVTRALSEADTQALLSMLPAWELQVRGQAPQIARCYHFKNFAQAMAFSNAVAVLAEAEKHHPALLTEWGKVTVTWWTHKIAGLHKNDFILAAKTDQLYPSE